MNEKLNIAEILKDCPKGMELDCTMYDSVQLKAVMIGNIYPIKVLTPEGIISLTKEGCYSLNPHCKCVIFPKGKTTWEGFQRPFKDGDVVYVQANYEYIAIYKELSNDYLYEYAIVSGNRFQCDTTNPLTHRDNVRKMRFATEEEKQKLFDAIKANGYKWNAETKTLEELENEKFDITTLKPFDKVLVRDYNAYNWRCALYDRYDNTKDFMKFITIIGGYQQCIPYEGNEHLLGTTNDCDEYYKTWE